MATDSDQRLEEFLREYGDDRRSDRSEFDIGYQGLMDMKRRELQRMSLEEDMVDTLNDIRDLLSENRASPYLGVTKYPTSDPDEPSGETMGYFVDSIKAHTYNVRVTNFIEGLVLPLTHSLTLLQEDKIDFERKSHHESVLYLSSISRSVERSGQRVSSSFADTLQKQYAIFMRHPVWNTLTLMNRYLITPALKASFGIMFGFSKKQSVEEKILDAIKQQTEFLMKGEIEPSRGFFGRLVQGGLVGLVGRTILTASGLGRNEAQRREDARARGESVGGWLSNTLLGIAYSSSDITRRGRHGYGHIVQENSSEVVSSTPRANAEAIESSSPSKLDRKTPQTIEFDPNTLKPLVVDITDAVGVQGEKTSQELSLIRQQVKSVHKHGMDTVVAEQNQRREDSLDNLVQRTKEEQFNKKQEEKTDEQISLLRVIRKDGTIVAREAVRARHMRTLSMLGGIVKSLGSLVATAATIGTFLVGKLPILLSGGIKGAKSVLGSPGARRAGGTILGAARRFGPAALMLEGYDIYNAVTDENRTTSEKVGDIAQSVVRAIGGIGGLAAGSAVGTAVAPGVGTFAGGAAGSIAGYTLADQVSKSVASWWATRGINKEDFNKVFQDREFNNVSDYMRARSEYMEILEQRAREQALADQSIISSIKDYSTEMIDGVRGGYSGLISASREYFSNIGENVKGYYQDGISSIRDFFSGMGENVATKASDTFDSAIGQITGFFSNTSDKVMDFIKDGISNLNPVSMIRSWFERKEDPRSESKPEPTVIQRIIPEDRGEVRPMASDLPDNSPGLVRSRRIEGMPSFDRIEVSPTINAVEDARNSILNTIPEHISEGIEASKKVMGMLTEYQERHIDTMSNIENYLKQLLDATKKGNALLTDMGESSIDSSMITRYIGGGR